MIKWLLMGAGAYYIYSDLKKKCDGAMADRAALLNILTEEQKTAILSGISQAAEQAKTVVAGVRG